MIHKYKKISLFYFILFLHSLQFLGCRSTTDLNWSHEDGYSWAEVAPPYFGSPGFEKLDSADTNVRFSNYVSEESIAENRNYLNGSGVATADVDGDGWVDIYFAQLEGPNKLYRNLGGFKFEDITDEANLAHSGYNSTGVVFADVNGDAYPDLLISSLKERNALYVNDGKGHFTLKKDSGLGTARGSNTMALADIDQDRDLDLYVTNYKLKSARDMFSARELTTQNTVRRQGDSLVVVPPFDQYYGIIETQGRSYRNEYGAKDELYLNTGDGTFQKADDRRFFLNEEGEPRGLSRDWGLAAKFHDLNGDLLPDLYVANDFWTPDRIWINRGDGRFKSLEQNAIRNLSFSSMGVDFSDINKDGATDLFVTEMLSADHRRRLRQLSEHLEPLNGRPQYNRNSLYLNRGDNTFAEISHFSNVAATEWSWAVNFLDIDLDGYEDLIITTGHAYDYQDMDTQVEMNRQPSGNRHTADILSYPRLELVNKMYRNNQDLTFRDQSQEWGFGEKDITHGMAIADLDNDGDADFAVNRLNRGALLYRNKHNAPRIAVRLKGRAPNAEGIGARVELKGAGVKQLKQVNAGGSYVSGSQHAVFFAASEDSNHVLSVSWPDGSVSRIDSVKANRFYIVDHSSAEPATGDSHVTKVENGKKNEPEPPYFEDVSNRIGHLHHEDRYTDTNVQPLLPVYLSRQGPGIAWIDYDNDRDDDLFITSGKGGKPGAYENNGSGRFKPVDPEGITGEAPGDQTAIVGWGTGKATNLLIGSANFEQGNPQVPSAKRYQFRGGQIIPEVQEVPGILSTTGPLAASDYDGDGDVDFFVGGRFVPGEYPRDATSRLFKNENGTFVLDQGNAGALRKIGMVTGSVFSDIDRDGDPDLVLSRSWDSIVLFENRGGQFTDVSSARNLDRFKGWWNGVATGDFNHDGYPDIVATNLGSNSPYQPAMERPLKLFYGDFDMDGTLDIIDSYYVPALKGYAPRRKLYELDAMPSVVASVHSHERYARLTVSEIFGQETSAIPSREINTVQHMVFLSGDEGYEPVPLPVESQLTSAFHAGVADFNADGKEDLFLSQNNFSFPANLPRMDAGRGLLLLGQGDGTFESVPGQQSGIKIYGEQRGAAVSDFNGDGRSDLAVTQNRGATKLFLNRMGKPGLRVRLNGPDGNKEAFGSGVRLIYQDNSKGPFKEVQAGAGYWSQSSATLVFGLGGPVKAVEVYWFDGTTQTVAVSGSQKEYVIEYGQQK